MSIVLYYAPWSSATTCLWAMEELAIPFEKVKLDLSAKQTHTPQFLALNPNGKVPLLVQDGTPIFESIAILAHLGETFGVEKNLFPAPGIARAQALQWLAWTNVTLAGAVSRFMQNTSDQVPSELRNEKVAAMARPEVQKLLGMVETHLARAGWMVGDGFTLVDVHLAGAMSWIGRLGFDTKSLANLAAWHSKCTSRPAFAKVMAT